MYEEPVKLGSRRLQKSSTSLSINIPRVAVNTLGLASGKTMFVTMMPDGALQLVKE